MNCLLFLCLLLTEDSCFQPFSFLVGKSWITTFPDGKTTDTQTYEWVYGGKFLRNRHEVKDGSGKVVYAGETLYAWDFQNKRIAWYYFNTTGGHLTGFLLPNAEGFSIEGVNHGPAGQTEAVKGQLVFATDGWSSVDYFLTDGKWRERNRVRYRAAP